MGDRGGSPPEERAAEGDAEQHLEAGRAQVGGAMRYAAVVTKEGKNTLATVPDAPGCQTFAEPGESIEQRIAKALQGWLEAELIAGRIPPEPRHRLPRGGIWVEVPALLA